MRPHLLTQQSRDRWSGPPTPTGTGRRPSSPGVGGLPVGELRRYIDWTPFFLAWEIKGRYPDVLNNPATAEQALPRGRPRMLDRIERERWLTARGVVGIFPANGVGDDIEVYADEARTSVLTTLHGLRQQGQHRDGVANKCLSDFVAPKETGVADHVGAFSVTAGSARGAAPGVQGRPRRLLGDPPRALADRLAEAFAERLHEKVRRELWGYAPDEHLSMQDLVQERYDGIRPAPGYPACPDHTEKETLMALLGGEERTGIRLTESMATWPAPASGFWYFAPPREPVLRRRPARSRPGRVVCRAQGLGPAHRRAVARPEPRLPARGLTRRGGGDGVSAPRAW